jgi:hypothetical protein
MVKLQAEEERARRVDMEKSGEWQTDAQVLTTATATAIIHKSVKQSTTTHAVTVEHAITAQ